MAKKLRLAVCAAALFSLFSQSVHAQDTDREGATQEEQQAASSVADGEKASDPNVQSPSEPLRVVVAGSPPFIEMSNGAPSGPSLDVWQRVATVAGVPYEIETASSVDAALDRVSRGEADVAVGPISITPGRAEQVAFTQPYFRSALGIAARPENEFIKRIEPSSPRLS